MIIYLIRHAQTVHNKKGKVFSGSSDVLLSEEGQKEAEKCKRLSFLMKSEKVFVTPLKRTHQTADLIFDKSIPREIIPSLAEMDFGDYEGRVLDEESESDEVFIKWMNDPESLTFPNGDNFTQHAREALTAFEKIAECGKEIVSVVSHRTTIRLIITQLLDKKLNTFREIPCDNCSVAKVIYENGKFRVDEMNITVK